MKRAAPTRPGTAARREAPAAAPARPRAARRETAAAAPKAAPLDASLFFKLVRVVNLTARPFMETLARRHRISLNEWRAMVVLASHPGAAATDIAEHSGLDKMTVSRTIAALERDGRIVRRADPADARRTLLTLTPDGERLFATIAVTAAQREVQLFAGLGAADHARLGAILERLIAALNAAPAPHAAASETEQAAPRRRRSGG